MQPQGPMQHDCHERPEHEAPPGAAVAWEDSTREYYYKPGELIVAQEDLAQAISWLGEPEAPPQELAVPGFVRLPLPRDSRVEEVMESLLLQAADGEEPRTVQVSPNYVASLASHNPWHCEGNPTAGAAGKDPIPPDGNLPGRGVTVGVVDTGIARHGWLDGRADGDPERPGMPYPCPGHGSFVAGVVLQHAPGAEVVVRAPGGGGKPEREAFFLAEVAEAILAMPEGVRVLNLPLGFYTHTDAPPPILARAIAELRRRRPEVVVTAAAGNHDSDRPFHPAAMKGVIAVAALERRPEEEAPAAKASFSAFGPWVDASAPGMAVLSTYPPGRVRDDWATWQGTSFAASRVAGAIAALSWQGYTPAEAAFRIVDAPWVRREPGLGAILDPPEYA